MTMRADLRARLLAAPDVAGKAAGGFDWGHRPQGAPLPGATLQAVSPGRDYTYRGAASTSGPRIQIDCWGKTMAEARRLADAVIAELERPAVVGGTRFAAAFLIADRDFPSNDATDAVERVSLDFSVWFSEK
jgi:hypothetical protein